jgi:tetratricopeptide (TPR) repeat protein
MIMQDSSKAISIVLDYYKKFLNDNDRVLIFLLSEIRGPLDKLTIAELPLIETDENGSILIRRQSAQKRAQAIERLVNCEILSYNYSAHVYSIHPLVRSHYQKQLGEDKALAMAVHRYLLDYYLYIDTQIGNKISLNHFMPLIEAVHHACRCGLYSDAWRIYVKKIEGPGDFILTNRLGAYDTALTIMREFFPEEDIEKKPNLNSDEHISQILSNVGFCLMSLGYLGNALSAFERENALIKEIKYKIRLSNSFQNLSRLYTYLGDLESATIAARKGIKAAEKTHASRIKISRQQINSMCMLAWSFHLRGFLSASGELFRKARRLNKDLNGMDFLNKFRGFFEASHLMKMGNLQEARKITESNLEKSREYAQISRCHQLLGDLDAAEGNYVSATDHSDLALKIARDIFRKEILIEALITRGRFKAIVSQDLNEACEDLSEALKYATESGYRIYEIDIRYCLAWTFLAKGNIPASRSEAMYAWQMSQNLGYYWGNIEATKVFSALSAK